MASGVHSSSSESLIDGDVCAAAHNEHDNARNQREKPREYSGLASIQLSNLSLLDVLTLAQGTRSIVLDFRFMLVQRSSDWPLIRPLFARDVLGLASTFVPAGHYNCAFASGDPGTDINVINHGFR